MKRNNLLVLLPAILVLSSCQAAPKENNQKPLKEDTFIEDSLAHDELFGDQFIGRKVNPLKANDPAYHPDDDVSIGWQSKIDNGPDGIASTDDDLISFRFIAPVTFAEGQLGHTNAVWTRTVSSKGGDDYPMDTGTYVCTEAYTQLEEGSGVYTIAEFNVEHSTSYTHFVVYTLRNIPRWDYESYYICAYLTLSGEGGVNQTTKAVAVSIDRAESMSFNAADGYFTMCINDSNFVNATSYGGGNVATFSNVDLNADDYVYISGFKNTKFYFYGYDKLRGDVNAYYFKDDGYGCFEANYKGSYTLFVNNDNEIWASVTNVVRPLYIRLDYVNSFWFSDNSVTRLYAFKDDGVNPKVEKWFTLEEVEEHKYYVTTEAIDPTIYDYVIVARQNPGLNEWWNQTVDIRLDTHDADDQEIKVHNCIAVWTSTKWEDGKNKQQFGWQYK